MQRRARDEAHRGQDDPVETAVPTISLDFSFTGTANDARKATILVKKHRTQRQKPTEPPHEHLTMLTHRKQTLTSHRRMRRITTITTLADPIRNVNRDA